MGRKKNSPASANAAETNNDAAVAEALAMIDADLNGEAEIADAVADVTAEVDEGLTEIEVAEPNNDDAQPDKDDMDAAIAELEAETEDTQAPKKASKSKSTKAKAAKTKPEPVATREFTSVASIDPATLKSNLDGVTAKKVNEKIQNVIQAVETGKRLSRYTADAVRLLKSMGHISSKSLVENYLSAGLSDGTARAQAQQMTALFRVLGIAMPGVNNVRELVLNDEPLVDELMKLAA